MAEENNSHTPPHNKSDVLGCDVQSSSPAVSALQQHMAKWYSPRLRASHKQVCSEDVCSDDELYCAVEGSR